MLKVIVVLIFILIIRPLPLGVSIGFYRAYFLLPLVKAIFGLGYYIKLSLYVTIQCIKNVQIFRKNYKIGGRNVS